MIQSSYVENSIEFYSPSVSFELESLIPQYLDQFRLKADTWTVEFNTVSYVTVFGGIGPFHSFSPHQNYGDNFAGQEARVAIDQMIHNNVDSIR